MTVWDSFFLCLAAIQGLALLATAFVLLQARRDIAGRSAGAAGLAASARRTFLGMAARSSRLAAGARSLRVESEQAAGRVRARWSRARRLAGEVVVSGKGVRARAAEAEQAVHASVDPARRVAGIVRSLGKVARAAEAARAAARDGCPRDGGTE